MTYTIEYYLTKDGVNATARWLKSLRDHSARAKITMRISRFEKGNFGDSKSFERAFWKCALMRDLDIACTTPWLANK